MNRPLSFRGKTGKIYVFSEKKVSSAWFSRPGVALFAAADGYGWRIIRISAMTGEPHDVRPVWAQADAARYGAEHVLILEEADAGRRHAIVADLEAGLSPVWSGLAMGVSGHRVALAA